MFIVIRIKHPVFSSWLTAVCYLWQLIVVSSLWLQYNYFTSHIWPDLSEHLLCVTTHSCWLWSFSWHRNGSFPAVCSEMCSAGGWSRDAGALCELEVVVKWKVAPSSFLSTENDLQAALWPHPLLCCRSLLLCRVSSPALSPSPTTVLTSFCTQMRALISCCYVVDSHSYIYFSTVSL